MIAFALSIGLAWAAGMRDTGISTKDDHSMGKSQPRWQGQQAPKGSFTATSTGSYTLAEVATHSSDASCWSVVHDNVYDLTTWISIHPGGKEAIQSICGKDGTAGFDGEHKGEDEPAEALAQYLIGSLKK